MIHGAHGLPLRDDAASLIHSRGMISVDELRGCPVAIAAVQLEVIGCAVDFFFFENCKERSMRLCSRGREKGFFFFK